MRSAGRSHGGCSSEGEAVQSLSGSGKAQPEYRLQVKLRRMDGPLADVSSSIAITASDSRKSNSPLASQDPEDGTSPSASLAVACGGFVPINPVQRLHELKPMTIDIAISDNGVGGCGSARKFDLQFDLFPLT